MQQKGGGLLEGEGGAYRREKEGLIGGRGEAYWREKEELIQLSKVIMPFHSL